MRFPWLLHVATSTGSVLHTETGGLGAVSSTAAGLPQEKLSDVTTSQKTLRVSGMVCGILKTGKLEAFQPSLKPLWNSKKPLL
jgi:hypothetical protein